MPLTRVMVETEIVDRCGAYLTLVGKETTTDGTNQSLNGPMGSALRHLSYPIADPMLISDADLAQVPDSQINLYYLLTEYYTLCNVASNYTAVTEKFDLDSQNHSDLYPRLKDRIADLDAKINGPQTLETGGIALVGRMRGGFIRNDPNRGYPYGSRYCP